MQEITPFESCLILNNSEKLAHVSGHLKMKNSNLMEVCVNHKKDGFFGNDKIDQKLIYIKTVP